MIKIEREGGRASNLETPDQIGRVGISAQTTQSVLRPSDQKFNVLTMYHNSTALPQKFLQCMLGNKIVKKTAKITKQP